MQKFRYERFVKYHEIVFILNYNIQIQTKTIVIKTYKFIGPLPEYCQDIDGTDRWSKIAGNGLDVVEQLSEVLNDRDPDNRNSYQH